MIDKIYFSGRLKIWMLNKSSKAIATALKTRNMTQGDNKRYMLPFVRVSSAMNIEWSERYIISEAIAAVIGFIESISQPIV